MTKSSTTSLESFVTAAINSGGQMMIMISSMGQAIEQSPGHDTERNPIGEELLPILSPRLGERSDTPSARDLATAARVLHWCTEALGQEIFGSEPGRPHSTWVPEVRARVRHMTDEELEHRRLTSPIPDKLDFLGDDYRKAG